jgi:2-polyprenyl-3-methyl-5-hydroxy-6-metoxy-1,4-benzoquinol methylase
MSQKFSDGASTWNQRFSGDDYLFGREPNDYLRSKAPLLPAGGSVLCVADGEGRNSVWLARQGFKVEAFDISEVGVTKARRLASEAGVSVDHTVADCEQYNWTAQRHDGVVAVFIQFADPEMRTRLFANIVRSLKPGGVLILQGYTPLQLEYKTGGPGQLSHLYTADLVREAFKDLQVVELVEYEAELNEGARHAGRSALLGLVATQP